MFLTVLKCGKLRFMLDLFFELHPLLTLINTDLFSILTLNNDQDQHAKQLYAHSKQNVIQAHTKLYLHKKYII